MPVATPQPSSVAVSATVTSRRPRISEAAQPPQAVGVELEPHGEGQLLAVSEAQHLVLRAGEADADELDRREELVDVGERRRAERGELRPVGVARVAVDERRRARDVARAQGVAQPLPDRLEAEGERW